MSTTPQWAVMPATDWDNIIAAVKEQTEDNTPLLSGEVAAKILSITAQPIKVRDGDSLFANNNRINEYEDYNLMDLESCSSMFNGSTEVQNLPEMNTSKCESFDNMFYDCNLLLSMPELDWSSVQTCKNMFFGCTALKYLTEVASAPNLTSTEAMFASSGITAPIVMDTSNITSMKNMYNNCRSLKSFPQYNTSKVTNFNSMFMLSGVYGSFEFDGSSGIDFSMMFHGTFKYNDTTITILNGTNKGTNFGNMCNGCWALVEVNGIDFSNATNLTNTFISCSRLARLTVVGTIPISLSLADSPLTAESGISVIDALVDYSGTDNEGTYNITFSSTTKNALNALGAVSPNGNTWLEYANDKGWNT